jgi:hypothetical protein
LLFCCKTNIIYAYLDGIILVFVVGEPLSHEELVRRDHRRRERKIMRQLEKQRRRLESRGIFKDLATLRLQWEEKRRNLLENPGTSLKPISENSFNEDDSDDEDDDDEIDVENDFRVISIF